MIDQPRVDVEVKQTPDGKKIWYVTLYNREGLEPVDVAYARSEAAARRMAAKRLRRLAKQVES